MIVYQSTKSKFLRDTDNRAIEDVIATVYLASTGRYVPETEIRSLAKVLRDEGMPDDMGVGVEFGIPQSACVDAETQAHLNARLAVQAG